MRAVEDEQGEDSQEFSNHPGESENKQDQGDGRQRTFQFAMRPFVIMMITGGNHLSKPHHRMRQLLRVAKEQVEQPAYE